MKKYLYKDLYDLEEKHWWHISKRRIVQNLIKRYNKIIDPKILDIGCGAGKNTEELLKYGKVWGIDNSEDAVRFCKKRGLKNVKLSNAEKTDLKTSSFDVITLLDVLEHTDDNRTLKEMQRILKENGVIILTVPAFSWLWSKWDEALHHKRRYTLKDLISRIEDHNFKVIYATYLYSFLILPALIVRRIKEKFFYNKTYPTDFQLSNPAVNLIMSFLSEMEFKLAQRIPLPFGTTILIIAKK